MSVIRWFFGRSRFSRIDICALILLSTTATRLDWQWWQGLLAFVGWGVVSVICEMIIFGEDYHRLSDEGQRVAQRRE